MSVCIHSWLKIRVGIGTCAVNFKSRLQIMLVHVTVHVQGVHAVLVVKAQLHTFKCLCSQ